MGNVLNTDLNFIGAELTICYHPLDEILAIGEILVIIVQVIQVNEKSVKTFLKPNIDKTGISVSAAYRDITSFIGLGLFDGNSVLFPLVVPCKKASHGCGLTS